MFVGHQRVRAMADRRPLPRALAKRSTHNCHAPRLYTATDLRGDGPRCAAQGPNASARGARRAWQRTVLPMARHGTGAPIDARCGEMYLQKSEE